jgi:predicted translation initiation factor SUI1
MTNPKPLIIFMANDPAAARAADDAFCAACAKLGPPAWATEVGSDLHRAKILVLVGDMSAPADWTGRVERWAGGDPTVSATGLIARLLGGSDEPPPPKPEGAASPPPKKKVHTVKLSRETAGRKGKGVTVVSELPLNEEQLKELATQLKNKCGTGGTAKDGRIEIQGDHRDRIQQELERLGYKVKRSGG